MNQTPPPARVLVTGASKGIGKALAGALIASGSQVVLNGRDSERLRSAADEVGGLAIAGDVGAEGGPAAIVAGAVEALGGLDLLVNNAGIPGRGPLGELQAADFERVFRVNVTGAALCAQEALPHLLKSQQAAIVNIGSTASLSGYPGGSIYASSKFALRALSQCWQKELRPKNVRVLHVNPSYVQTGFGQPDGPAELSGKHLVADDIASAIVGALTVPPRGFVPELTVWATNPFED